MHGPLVRLSPHHPQIQEAQGNEEELEMNDNKPEQDWRKCKYLNENWHQYDEIKMTIWGPIGIIQGQGFVYLDPEIREWRSA